MRRKVVVPDCEVCGEKGVGRNFGAISCESCKTFFRRNSGKENDFNCKFGDKCEVKQRTRNSCKKCRLMKCFSVGMKKEFIQTKEQNNVRKMKMKINRQKRIEEIISSESTSTSSSSSSPSPSSPPSTDDNTSDGTRDLEVDIDDEVIVNIYQNNANVFQNVLALNKSMKDITKDGGRHPMDINQRLTQYLTAPLLRPINTYNDLNEIECKHLLDLCLATDVFSVPSAPHNYIHVNNIHEFYTNWGNRIETDTHCVVSIIKALTKNVDICHNDQIALVKYSSMEISVLRANYDYDLQTEKWTLFIQDPCNLCVFPLDVLKDEKRNLYGVYKSHLNKIIPEWNWDRVLVDLLTVIILFNPNRPNIINSDIVKFRQQLYIYLLQRYLSMKYKWEWLWNYKMSNLMNALVDLNVVSRIEILNGIEDYIDYFGPISQEMFRDIYNECETH